MAGYNDPESGYTPGATGFFALLGHIVDITNKFDKDAAPADGDVWTYDTTGGVYVPTALPSSIFGASTGVINIKDPAYGAVGNGSTDDTAAINAARAAGSALYFPAGNFVYTGSGLDWVGLSIQGAGRDQTRVTLGSGCSLVVGTGTNTKLRIADMEIANGFGAVRITGTGGNVGPKGMHTIERVDFYNYTGTAISHLSTDSPNWTIRECVFYAANDTAAMGVVLPGDTNNCLIDHCAFGNNKVHVKLGPAPGVGSTGMTIRHSDFIYGNVFSAPRTDVWVVPTSTPQGGPTIQGCKFGSENRNAADFSILIADEDTATGADASTRLPKTSADSTASVQRMVLRDCRWASAGVGAPVIYSTASSVRETTIRGLQLGGNLPDYIMEFRTTTNVATDIGIHQGTIDGLVIDGGNVVAMSNSSYLPMVVISDPRHTISPTLTATATYDPPSLAAGAAANTTVTVTGAAVGDMVLATHQSVETAATSWVVTGYVSAANTVRVVILNGTGGTVDLGSGTLRVQVFKQ